ncbi:hypothetical protein KPSA3_04887 [Pseudomonas syringae pv. actinidiae]|uniref:Uncharacterized protein n=1 Tax=Pseudomonas syringae pv. actinidiae TaxID=103796 RepID=A0AAN4Q9F3_PSESF|nr:hypothetical protein KPSA3_04887 [Pseudomonas syringae pv. actinidiae]
MRGSTDSPATPSNWSSSIAANTTSLAVRLLSSLFSHHAMGKASRSFTSEVKASG